MTLNNNSLFVIIYHRRSVCIISVSWLAWWCGNAKS